MQVRRTKRVGEDRDHRVACQTRPAASIHRCFSKRLAAREIILGAGPSSASPSSDPEGRAARPLSSPCLRFQSCMEADPMLSPRPNLSKLSNSELLLRMRNLSWLSPAQVKRLNDAMTVTQVSRGGLILPRGGPSLARHFHPAARDCATALLRSPRVTRGGDTVAGADLPAPSDARGGRRQLRMPGADVLPGGKAAARNIHQHHAGNFCRPVRSSVGIGRW